MEIIKGGVIAPEGFLANGVHCGLRKCKDKKDLALVYSDVICNAAAVYTQNKVKSNPIHVTHDHIKDGKAQAVVINSANANTCNGKEGLINAYKMTEFVAHKLNIKKENILVASTGIIGEPLDINAIESGMDILVGGLSKEGNVGATEAILTTDLIQKEIAVSIKIGDKDVKIGAMAKGSGMIHPNMATMLGFVTTDINIDATLLKEALVDSVNKSFNRISVDGDTSTNDMVCVLANGKANNKIVDKKDDEYNKFLDALTHICITLAKLIAKDGEGATKLISCEVEGALSEEHGISLAKSVICSPLVKAAMFGSDANWGRIICALGYNGMDLNPDTVDIGFESSKGCIQVCKDGTPVKFDEDKAKAILLENEVSILININMGNFKGNAWGCDLSYDYVKINGDYRG